MTSAPEANPVVIAGAGIAGLAAALALANAGRSVLVLERRPQSSEEGAGIQIGPNGSRILERLGVMPFLSGCIARPQAIEVRDGRSGNLLTRLPLGQAMEARFGAPYCVLHRADLHAGLREAAASNPLIQLRLGAEVRSARSTNGCVTISLSSGEQLRAPLLIGADGIWSRLRREIMQTPSLRFTGKCALRAVIAASEAPPQISLADTTIWLIPDAHVVHYPVRAGGELAIVAIFDDAELGETWAEAAEPSVMKTRARSFPPALRDLLARPASWRQWSLYSSTLPIPWVQDRVVLIGDAAHPTLPFLAQGGVMALEDAVVLAGLIADAEDDDLPARLLDYERLRRPRTARIVDASTRNGAIYHQDGFMRLARNRVLATLPPHLLMRQYDWLYGWKPEDALTNARIPAGKARAP